MSFSGISYLGQHSYKDLGLTISARDVGAPNKVKVKERIPFSNQVYDFSELYGSQTFEERQMTYTFDLMKPRLIDTNTKLNVIKTRIVNWLAGGQGQQPLYDDVYPQYYFLAEVESGPDFTKNWTHGNIDVTFTAYPFMTSKLPEGHDIWDEFNFELDVAQETTFDLTVSWDRFKELNIGDEATYGAWATQYLGGTPINMEMLGQTYRIIDKRYEDQSRSRIAYKFDDIDEWLIEQDVIQAQTEFLDFNLINNGISTVAPTIKVDSKITLVKDGTIYNLMPGTFNDSLFTLKTGDNHIQGYTSNVGTTIDFDWHKELI